MFDGKFLNQDEINALLNHNNAQEELLEPKEPDAPGEASGMISQEEVFQPAKDEDNPAALGRVPEKELSSPEQNIDLILDIPLKVSVVLGRTRKPIKEILRYQSGSVVELNRLVEENVDIMVNDVLVARGEVVVVNDNFGVRISNIINPNERIAQLKNGVLF